MATKVALGHHHAIVVVAVEVSTVGGSTRVGQMRPMPDRELVARGRKVEGTAGRGVGHIGDGAGERRGDGGRAGGLGVRGDVRETAAREKGTTSAQGQPRQRNNLSRGTTSAEGQQDGTFSPPFPAVQQQGWSHPGALGHPENRKPGSIMVAPAGAYRSHQGGWH